MSFIEPFIRLTNISKTFGKKNKTTVLKNVNLQIEAGQSVAVLGKSGSGKSTLINIMSGLSHPSTGQVLYSGQDLFAQGKKDPYQFRRDNIGLVFQSFHLQPNNTVFNNVMLSVEIAGRNNSMGKQKAREALELVELGDKLKEKVVNLSGGQKQRVAIARSIVNHPKVIFADEPTGNLDTNTGNQIMKVLLDLQKYLGTTLIIVTHDYTLAEKCQAGIYVKDGQVGSMDDFHRVNLNL